MKIIVTFLFLLLCTVSFSQTVLVKGTAKDTTSVANEYFPFRVILNDTLNKFRSAQLERFSRNIKANNIAAAIKMDSDSDVGLLQLNKNRNFVITPGKKGAFQIRAKLTDTLYFTSFRFVTQKYAVSDLMNMKRINIKLAPEVCEKIVKCDEKNRKLYGFIAEKISLNGDYPYYCDRVNTLDGRYQAKYKVLKNIYGDLKMDTVDFTVYDHYGMPKFSKYKYVMLFVSDHCGKLIHEKYQYYDVYPTEDGRWARPGDPYQLDQKQAKLVKPIAIKFNNGLSFDITDLHPNRIKELYPEPYFKIVDNKALPLTGAYADELFSIKKDGVLKARGFIF